jgi:general secretion pathway protein M
MNEILANARAYWAARTPRERLFLMLAALVVAIGILYGLILDPMLKTTRKLSASLPKQRAEIRLLRAQVAEIERLRTKGGGSRKTGSALLHSVETAAAAHGARAAVTNLASLADDQVRVQTGPLAVSTWLAWFNDLDGQGITVLSCRTTMGDKPGLASVDAVLTGGAK